MDSSSRYMPAGALCRNWSCSPRRHTKHWRTRALSRENSASVIRPRTRSADMAGKARRNAGTASGASPYLLASPEVLTWTKTSSARPSTCRRRSRASARRRLSRAWNSLAKRATSLALLVCRWPMTDQRRSVRSCKDSHLPQASCTLFSPSIRQPAAWARRRLASGLVLLTGSSRTLAASRPARWQAAAMRAWTAARLC